MMERKEFITDEMLEYLDDLRESVITNMFGAVPYIREVFPELSRAEAREVLTYWMRTFGERQEAA